MLQVTPGMGGFYQLYSAQTSGQIPQESRLRRPLQRPAEVASIVRHLHIPPLRSWSRVNQTVQPMSHAANAGFLQVSISAAAYSLLLSAG
jgi:hypothetical protein